MSQPPMPPSSPPPLPIGYALAPNGQTVQLKKVAIQQRALILCILAEIVIAILQMTVAKSVPIAGLILGLIYIATAITGAVFLFMLAISIYNVGLGIVFGILTLVPLLGLIILLVINGKATNILRANGVKVGFLGANPATVAER